MAAEPARPLSPAPTSEPVRWPPWPEVAYPLWPDDLSRWFLPEDDEMPWTTLLTALQRHLFSCLRKLLEEQGRDWFVGYEQKMRLDPHDQRVGVLPDLYVLPCQPEDPNFAEWPAYVPGIPVPVFALEAVSPSNWEKDYVEAPQKYAKLGVEELLVFDAQALEGKSPASDPYVLQLYRKDRRGRLKRVYAGEGPVYSEALGGWFRTEGPALTISRDQTGTFRVLTYEETEGWWKKLEEERAAKGDAERKAQKEAQARQVAEEARLAAEQAKKDAERKARNEAQAREAAEQAKKDAETKARDEAQAREAAEQAKKDAETKAQNEAQAREAAEQARLAAEQAKMDAERKAQHEAQAREIAEQAKRDAESKAQNEVLARKAAEQQALLEARLALIDLCDLLGLEWNEERRQQVDSLDLAALRQLRNALKLHKRWPG